MAEETVVLQIEGMTCDGCAQGITHSLKRAKGIKRVKIDWRAGLGKVAFDPVETDQQEILENRAFAGHYRARLSSPGCCS